MLLPFQGVVCWHRLYPGRCPGLGAGCPFRAHNPLPISTTGNFTSLHGCRSAIGTSYNYPRLMHKSQHKNQNSQLKIWLRQTTQNSQFETHNSPSLLAWARLGDPRLLQFLSVSPCNNIIFIIFANANIKVAAMVELVDTRDLKSLSQKWLCGFESRSRHNKTTK
jgi:hypothetical protein